MSDAFREFGESLSSAVSNAASAMAALVLAQRHADLQDGLELIRDRAIAFEHARICAGLVWPYRMTAPTEWLDRAKKAGLVR
jgi:hypothetical protein